VGILTDFSREMNARMPLRGSEVLDIGCGDGAFAHELARAGAQVTGLECSPAMLSACRAAPTVAGERYVEGVAQALPFADDAFDAAVFRASLHHVPAAAMATALAEARRVTRPGGELFVFEPLATGDYFEMVRLVDDETRVRGQAQQAITGAIAAGRLSRRHQALFVVEVVYPDLESLRQRFVAIDPSRARAFDAQRAGIDRLFRSGGVATDRGRLFTQPIRLDVLA
jgi:SAM-dependent methyltransferase